MTVEDAPKPGIVLSIEQAQRIDLTADGRAVRGYETYIREYVGVIESGLMARLSNAAYKVLHALALRARILGDPRRPGAEEEFEELRQLGVVTANDKGLLFCFPSRDQVMKDTGIGSVHTVDAAMLELSENRIVKRVSSAQPRLGRGWFGPNIYLIHPESFIAKFGGDNVREAETASRDGEQKVLSVNGPSVQKTLSGHPVEDTESTLRNSMNRALKINNNDQQDQVELISKHFAASIRIDHHTPSEKEKHKIALLLAEGYTVQQICAGVTRSVERAAQAGRTIHSISYCIPTVREHSVQAAERKADLGKPHAVIQPNPDLGQLAQGNAELQELLEIVQERNPGRALQKSDVRAWQALAQRFRDLATARNATPIVLVTQAVLRAIGSHSDRGGYLAPRLAETILEAWQREHEERQLQASEDEQLGEASQQHRRDKRQRIALPAIQTSDGLVDPAQIWETALKELQLQMTKATFDAWVRSTIVAEAQDGEKPMLVIGTHNPYAVEWLERRLHVTIQRTVVGIVGKDVDLEYRYVDTSKGK